MLRLKYELECRGITQSELAKRCKRHKQTISRIVNGKEGCSPKRQKLIADAIGWDRPPGRLFEEIEIKEV